MKIRFRAPLFALAASLMLAGCSDIARLVTPSGPVDTRPARVAFTASVATLATHADDAVSLRVTASYVQTGGARVVIGTQLLQLTSASSQSVPIPVDLATCIGDATHDGANTDGGCSVVLELALIVNSIVVDNQTVGPLRLAAGATTEISQPIKLFEITSIDLTPSTTQTLTVGGTNTFAAVVRDSRGVAVTDRTVVWSTDAATIATVDASGKVSAVSAGDTRVTAMVGAISNSVSLHVTKPPVALVVAAVAGSGSGSVTSTPAGIDCKVNGAAVSGTCTANFAADAQVQLTSTADAGQLFGAWSGACAGNAVGVNCTLTMAQARIVSAQFIPQRHVIVSAVGGDGKGRVTGPFGIDCRMDGVTATGVCFADVADGTPVPLTSVADAIGNAGVAQVFGTWGGDCSGATGNSCTLTATANKSASASFFDGKTLALTLEGAGGGTVTSAGLTCTRSGGSTIGSCTKTVVHGTSIVLQVAADAASSFVGWSGACTGQSATCTVAMTQARTATATFAVIRRVTIFSAGGDGKGSVTGAFGINCTITAGFASGSCAADIPDGTLLFLTATPDGLGGQTFAGWGAACSGTAPTCTVNMVGGSRVVSASFNSGRTLSVGIDGTGGGTVSSTVGIACARTNNATSGVCSVSAADGATVTLAALEDAQSTFTSWSGACAGQGANCSLAMTATRNATATFTRKTVPLTLKLAGTGNGSVAINGEIACSRTDASSNIVTCVKDVAAGTSISISANAGAGTDLVSNSGDCSGTGPCTLAMTEARTVTSTFAAKLGVTFTLTGSGSGTVTSTEVTPVIDCTLSNGVAVAGRCSASLPANSSITLRATGATGNALANWGGSCASSNSYECSLSLTISKLVSVAFVPGIDVEMRVSGSALGSVTFQPVSAPAQAPCVLNATGATVSCRFSLPTGSEGVFRGVSAFGSHFDGFVGPCVESTSLAPVPLCTYRGISFLKLFTASFNP